tara:strand:- start:8245 stop:8442 length:198 start_codon:yes stop_codon:yes gene_type:complete
MYIKTQLIPNNNDEWVTTLFLDDGTKVKADVTRGYHEAVTVAKQWSEENDNCTYDVSVKNKNWNE